MSCIKTGCDVYLASHCGVLHGDMFKVADVYILHHTGMENMKIGNTGRWYLCHFTFNDYGPVFDGDCMYLDSVNIISMNGYLVDEYD